MKLLVSAMLERVISATLNKIISFQNKELTGNAILSVESTGMRCSAVLDTSFPMSREHMLILPICFYFIIVTMQHKDREDRGADQHTYPYPRHLSATNCSFTQTCTTK